MTTPLDFLGIWALDPDSCNYPDGLAAPAEAVYTILLDGVSLYFHARWLDPAGESHHIALSSPSDGTAVPGAVDDVSMRSFLDADALITVVERDGKPIHTTHRELVEGVLRIRQRILTDLGWANIEAHYRRTSAKQVLVYRRDLKMRKGKIAAQCAHAAMAVFFQRNRGSVTELNVPLDGPMAAWVGGRFTKICLSCDDEEALVAAYEAAKARGIPCSIITDAGRTEFHGVPTRTAIALGPAAITEIDAITGPDGLVACKLA